MPTELDVMEPRLSIGANNPPEAIEPTPFDLSKDEIEGLFMEATNWLDGEDVTTQEQADAIGKLITDLRAAAKVADARRVTENKPFDEGKAEVQARYNPLIQKDRGKVDLAISTCKKALAPYLKKIEEENLAKAEAARKEADAKAEAARAAFAASQATDLAARQEAERLLDEAKKAEKTATKAENAKAHANGGGRAIGMRSVFRAEITDETAFARYLWTDHREMMSAFLTDTAKALVDHHHHTIPGVTVHHERVPV